MLMYYVFGQLTKHLESTQSARKNTPKLFYQRDVSGEERSPDIFLMRRFIYHVIWKSNTNPTILKEIHVASPDENPKVDRRSFVCGLSSRLFGSKVSGFYVNVFQRPCLMDQASHPNDAKGD